MSAYNTPDEIVIREAFAAADLTTSGRDLFVGIEGALYRVAEGKVMWGTAGGASCALHLRKITDTSAPNAAAGATVIELLTGDEQALTGSALTPVDLDFITTEASLRVGPDDRLAFHLDATISPLANLLLELKLIKLH